MSNLSFDSFTCHFCGHTQKVYQGRAKIIPKCPGCGDGQIYRGWQVCEYPDGPVTGRWRAHRHGVRIGTNTLQGLKELINTRNDVRSLNEARASALNKGAFTPGECN